MEFEAELRPDGTLKLPLPIARKWRTGPVTVRITAGGVGRKLRARGITEGEIERIALKQFERREHVIDFLMSEGGLARSAAFAERARRLSRAGR